MVRGLIQLLLGFTAAINAMAFWFFLLWYAYDDQVALAVGQPSWGDVNTIVWLLVCGLFAGLFNLLDWILKKYF